MESQLERTYLKTIIQDHLTHHRGFRVQDLYKMLHQATCGNAHLLVNPEDAEASLFSEWTDLDRVQKGESLLEVIDPSGKMIRINLRVYRKMKNTPLDLLKSIKRTAEYFVRDEQRLVRYWESIMEWSVSGEIPFGKDEVEDFWIDMGCQGFPAVHHSEAYTAANRPAYRIVLKSFWEGFAEKRTMSHET